MTHKYHIPGQPKPQPRPRVTRSGTYDPAKQHKISIQYLLLAQRKHDIIDQPIAIELEFFLQHKTKTGPHTSRPDIDNLAKLILDAANHILYTDDSLIYSLKITKQYDHIPKTILLIHVD